MTAGAVRWIAWLGVTGRIQKGAKLLLKEDGWYVRYPGANGARCLVQLSTPDYDEAYEKANLLLSDPKVEWIIS